MVWCTWYGVRYELRDGASTGNDVLLLDELAMMYDAMDFASEAGTSGIYLDYRQVVVVLWW